MEHIGEKILRDMLSKGMVEHFLECGLEVNFCEQCIYGKQSQGSHLERQGQVGFYNWCIVMCLARLQCLHLVDPCIMPPS
jgi:hypothetical protein